jgi:hypothetical protein
MHRHAGAKMYQQSTYAAGSYSECPGAFSSAGCRRPGGSISKNGRSRIPLINQSTLSCILSGMSPG